MPFTDENGRMAQETKVGLLVGLALILLVGLVLSDLLTGEEPEADPANSPTNFSRGVQDDIYHQPDSTPRTDNAAADSRASSLTQANPPAGYDAAGYPSRGMTRDDASPDQLPTTPPAPPSPADSQFTPGRGSSPADPLPSREPLLPELDTQDARQPGNAVARFDASLEAMRLAARVPSPSSSDASSRDERIGAVRGVAVTDGPALPVPTEVADEPALPSRSGGQTVHLYVQAGQSLADIARQHYGNPEYARILAQVNADRLTRSGIARPGTRLDLPPLDSPAFQRMLEPVHAEHADRTPEAVPQLPSRPPATSRPAAADREIQVSAGDTLSELASVHLGSGSRWDELLKANRDQLESPQDLRAGMTLRLPDRDAAPDANATRADRDPASSSSTTSASASRASATTYTVVAGDNLTRIATRFLGDGERWDELLDANADQLSRPEQLRVGMVLKLPAGNAVSGETATEVSPPAPPLPSKPIPFGPAIT